MKMYSFNDRFPSNQVILSVLGTWNFKDQSQRSKRRRERTNSFHSRLPRAGAQQHFRLGCYNFLGHFIISEVFHDWYFNPK